MDANTTPKPFIVTRDGELDTELSTLEPRMTAITMLTDKVVHIKHEARLQAQMAWYDTLHGTKYRHIRNKLAAERRNRAFEARIGIERI